MESSSESFKKTLSPLTSTWCVLCNTGHVRIGTHVVTMATYLLNSFGHVVLDIGGVARVDGSVQTLPSVQCDGVFVPRADDTEPPMRILDNWKAVLY